MKKELEESIRTVHSMMERERDGGFVGFPKDDDSPQNTLTIENTIIVAGVTLTASVSFQRPVFTRLKAEETWLKNSKLASSLDIDECNILPTGGIVGESIGSFDYDTFVYYVYWRSQLRHDVLIDTPYVFAKQYIREICNFLEEKTPNAIYERLLALSKKLKNEKWTSQEKGWFDYLLHISIRTMLALYSDHIYNGELKLISIYESYPVFMWDYSKQKVLSGSYRSGLDFIYKNCTYKVKREAYQNGKANMFDDCLVLVLKRVRSFSREKGFDIIRKWIGERVLSSLRHDQYYFVNPEYFREKEILVKGVTTVRIYADRIEANHFETEQRVYFGGKKNVLSYILWKTESVLREEIKTTSLCFGKKPLPNLKPSLRELQREITLQSTFNNNETTVAYYKKLVELYSSKEFDEIVSLSVLDVINKYRIRQ